MVSAASSSVPPASSSRTSPLHLTSSEINILIHCYLLESNLAHSAFTFALETKLASLPEVGKKIPRGELLRWLHRGLAWQEVEAHVGEDGPLPPCSSPFTLLTPHVCDPIPPSTPSPSSSHIPLPSTQQPVTLPIASTSTTAPPPPPRPELFPEPAADDTTTVAPAVSVGSSSAKGKRKAVNGGGEKHGDADSESGSVGEKSTGGKKDESNGGGSSSKRARVEKEKKEDVDAESRKAQTKAAKAAPKPLPLPSFQRKSTSSSTSNPPRPTSSSSSTTSSKPTSPSATLHSLPNTSSNLNSSNNHTSSSTTAGTSSTKKSNSTTTSPTLSSNRTLAPNSTTTTGTSQKKKKPSASTSTSSTQASSSSSTPAFVDKAPGLDYTKTIRTVSLSFEASPDGSSSSEEGESSAFASASTSTAAGKSSSSSVAKGKNGKNGKGKDAKGSGKGKGKVRIFGGEHNGEVFVCKFSPVKQSGGGEVLATGAGDATVRLWEFQPPGALGSTDPEGWSMEESPTICKHLPVTDRKDITSIDFNPPGTLIGTASYDGIARLWTPEGELHGVLTRHSGAIFCLKFNPTGSLLATAGSDGSVCVWEADSARLRQAYEFHSDCTLDVDWLDDDTLASCSMDKTITICRVGSSTPYRTFRGHTDEVNRVAWSPAPPSSSSDIKPSSSSFGFGSSASASSSSVGRVLASCSDDATVRIWGLDVEPSTSSDDGGFQNGRLEKYCKGVLRGHEKEIYTFAFAPTSVGSSSSIPILATASFDQTVRLWDISSLSCLRVLRAHTETVFSISFSPSGRHLASAGWDKLMVVWETETGRPVRHRAGEAGIFELEWSKNAGVVAVCQSDKSVVLVDVKELE